MGEPTIPEAAVEAAAKAMWRVICEEMPETDTWDKLSEDERQEAMKTAWAALAAAEPLMHAECRRNTEDEHQRWLRATRARGDLRAENARLREALERLTDAVAGTQRIKWSKSSTLRRALFKARAALAPSDEEGARNG